MPSRRIRNVPGSRTGAANAWSVIVTDPARHLVFVPTGSASPDYYGGERKGDDKWANSVVALQAKTGKLVWGFQLVHHDLWDYDTAAPPLLTTLVRKGARIPVVIQGNKTGNLFVLNRENGKACFPGRKNATSRKAKCRVNLPRRRSRFPRRHPPRSSETHRKRCLGPNRGGSRSM